MRIFCRRLHAAKRQLKPRRGHCAAFRLRLHVKLVKQDLIENDLANLAIEFPDLLIERRHDSFVLIENFISDLQQLAAQFLALVILETPAAILFEEPPQNVVQQFAGIKRLQIQRGLAARFEFQNSLREEAISTNSKSSQTAGAVNNVDAESTIEECEQMRIADLPVVWSKAFAPTFAFNRNTPQS